MTKQTAQTFSCTNCGHAYELYPPETGYNIMRRERCQNEPETHNIDMRVECENCHQSKTVYWCPGHFYVSSGSFEQGRRDSVYGDIF